MAERSNRPEVRNPVLALPAFAAVAELPADARQALRSLVLNVRDQARAKGDESLRQNKYMMFAYWRVVGVYAGHIARAIGRVGRPPA